MATGFMPYLSSTPTLVSSVRLSPSTSQVCYPWRIIAGGGGSGKGSSNKLVWRPVLVKMEACSPCALCRRGGGREPIGESVPTFLRSTVASETGLRLRIRGSCNCSDVCSSSVTCCGRTTAPSLAAGFSRSVADRSGRRAAIWSAGDFLRRLHLFLPASMPDGWQFGHSSASVSPLSGKRERWSDGEIFIRSSCVPRDGDFGSTLWSRRRRTRLHSTACIQRLFCKVLGLSCNFLFFGGPWISCTALQN